MGEKTSPLILAAESFDAGLTALEALAKELERASITSQKTLHRSGVLLQEAVEMHEQLGARLGDLVRAIETTRLRQQAGLDRILVETKRVDERGRSFREIMDRFSALGARAHEVQDPVQAVLAKQAAGATPESLVQEFAQLDELTATVVAEADAVVEAARAGDWTEVARDAQALRQSLQSARNRLSLARKEVAARAPS